MKKLIPADTVDAEGNVWETTGENIRNGAKEFSENDVKSIVNILFPVNSVYCGENSLILSVGKWNQISINGAPLISSAALSSGHNITSTYIAKQQMGADGLSLRMWKRVS